MNCRGTRRAAYIAILICFLTITVNLLLFHDQLSRQQTLKDGNVYNKVVTFGRSLLDTPNIDLDSDLLKVLNQIPEISEEMFFQTMELGNLKIYIYELPPIYNEIQLQINAAHPPKIWDPNCTANFYSAEISLHRFLLKSTYRTLDPWEADFFYVPAYTCCFLINNHPNNLTKTAIFHQKLLNHIRTKYPFLNLSMGRDHVWAFTQGFGAQLFGNWRQIKGGIFLVHNGQFTLDEFTPYKDLTIPPDLSGYNFSAVYELPSSMRPERKWLGHFGGTVLPMDLKDERGSRYSKGVRQYIKEHYMNDPDFRITGTRANTYIHDMMTSVFCLCPEGWHAWNPRPYQAVILGCIPVILSEELELAFEEVIDYSKFVIRVRPRDVSNLKVILENVSKEEIEEKRKEMERLWRLFSYGPNGLAPHMILKMLARRKTMYHIRREYQTIL